MLSVHLAVGVGFYHHLILKLQLEYGLDLVGAIDFAFQQNDTRSSSVSFFNIVVCFLNYVNYLMHAYKSRRVFIQVNLIFNSSYIPEGKD